MRAGPSGNTVMLSMPSEATERMCSTADAESPVQLPLDPPHAARASMPAVANALVDALSHLGVRHVEMPATPERLWRVIQGANAG